MPSTKRSSLILLLRALALAGVATFSAQALASDEVSLYTTREPKLIQPLLDAFAKDSGIKVNTVFVKDGLLERVRAEGDKSPADVLMTVDIGNLIDLVNGGVTQKIQSQTLDSVVPANLRGAEGAGTPCRCATGCSTSRKTSSWTASATETWPTPNGRARCASARASTPTTPRWWRP